MKKLIVITIILYFIAPAFAGIVDEKSALQDSYYGDFEKATVQKKRGRINLEVWKPYIQYVKKMPPHMQKVYLNCSQKLIVDFDEIWIAENDEYLTKSEKTKYKGQLDIMKLYWKGGKVQAYTLEIFYKANPLTETNLSHPSHKLTNIINRKDILKKLSK